MGCPSQMWVAEPGAVCARSPGGTVLSFCWDLLVPDEWRIYHSWVTADDVLSAHEAPSCCDNLSACNMCLPGPLSTMTQLFPMEIQVPPLAKPVTGRARGRMKHSAEEAPLELSSHLLSQQPQLLMQGEEYPTHGVVVPSDMCPFHRATLRLTNCVLANYLRN